MTVSLHKNKQAGFVSAVFFVFVVLVILGVLDVSIKDVLKDALVQENLQYGWMLALQGLAHAKDILLDTLAQGFK